MESPIEPEDVYNTEEEAYEMSYSIALRVLNEIMLDEDESTECRIGAASVILDHDPIYEVNFTADKEE